MKIFISWSGDRSREVAELLADWIKCVLQASRPWLSTRNIDRGAIWFTEIQDHLKDTSIGIVCLTQENREKSWILFEAGALAKGLSTNRVCTFLIDLKPSNLEPPLSQFNHTFPSRESIYDLVKTLNNCLSPQSLDERILAQVFDTYWPQFESKFAEIIAKPSVQPTAPVREINSILEEILENTRSFHNRLRSLELKSEISNSIDSKHAFFSDHNSLATRALVKKMLDEGTTEKVILDTLKKRGYGTVYSMQLIRGIAGSNGGDDITISE